jgi:hypothetical protein
LYGEASRKAAALEAQAPASIIDVINIINIITSGIANCFNPLFLTFKNHSRQLPKLRG